MQSASELLSGIAHKIYEWQTAAFESGISLGEEAITEFMMLELGKNKGQVATHQWTKKREAKNGADYDLIIAKIIDNDLWYVRFAVQAKRLYQTGKYEHLKQSKYSKQHTKFLEYARRSHAIPIYLLYNSVGEAGITTTPIYKNHKVVPADFGCTICPPEIVDEVISGGIEDTFGGINGNMSVRLLKDLIEKPIEVYELARCIPDIRRYPYGTAEAKTDSLGNSYTSERVTADLESIYRSKGFAPRFSSVIYDGSHALY